MELRDLMKNFLRIIVFVVICIVIKLIYSYYHGHQISTGASLIENDSTSSSVPKYRIIESNTTQANNKRQAANKFHAEKTENPDYSLVENSMWGLNKLDPAAEVVLRRVANIENGIVEKIDFNAELIKNVSVGDTISLQVPGGNSPVEVKIKNISISNDIKTIVGSIDELGLGYGATFSQSGTTLVGDLIIGDGSWSIDTVDNVTFITNGRKSHGLERDVP